MLMRVKTSEWRGGGTRNDDRESKIARISACVFRFVGNLNAEAPHTLEDRDMRSRDGDRRTSQELEKVVKDREDNKSWRPPKSWHGT